MSSPASLAAVLSSTLSFVLTYGAICLALYITRYLIVLFVVGPCKSYLRHLPGPPTNGYFAPNQMFDLQTPRLAKFRHEEYEKLYGKTIRFQGMGYFDNRLMTVDPVALNYILNRGADLYPKSWQTQRYIQRLANGGSFSRGIMVTEGEEHRMLRRIIAPAFSFQSIKNITPLFLYKSFELRDKLRSFVAAPHEVTRPGIEVDMIPGREKPLVRLDLHNWIGRISFDIVGRAAFGYEFGAIQEETNETYNAYRCMFDALRQQDSPIHNAALFVPDWIASRLPDARTKEVQRCRKIIEATSQKLLASRREAFACEKSSGGLTGKDFSVLDLLLRTSESSKTPLTDSEILAQIDTIMFAGHDSSSLTMTWALWELARYPSVQARLRAELEPFVPLLKSFAPTNTPESNYADLTGELGELASRIDALPFFENVVRETLRFHPTVQSTLRVAARDDVIPVSEPVCVGERGEVSRAWVGGAETGLPSGGIRIRKGEFIHIPLEGMNVSKDIWGQDAHEFNPDRWNNLPKAAKANPGLYANLMNFSIGPSSCPASRWALVEIKMILAVLVASFDFSGASPMKGHNFMVVRPFVDGEFDKGHRMPLIVTPL
ncbi:cytochrome P450 family protein [Ceratobasidium sp. AG-Ba]|nr:cytochrome P450 family protein [Ceratobasidium sp. AG-Ba]QRW08224.1 cytochrome P450 family protein [Ceratobasidium sp. AG-Ba]